MRLELNELLHDFSHCSLVKLFDLLCFIHELIQSFLNINFGVLDQHRLITLNFGLFTYIGSWHIAPSSVLSISAYFRIKVLDSSINIMLLISYLIKLGIFFGILHSLLSNILGLEHSLNFFV